MNIIVFYLLFIFLAVPIILTVINLFNLIAPKKTPDRFKAIMDIISFALGITFTIFLVTVGIDFVEWNVPLYTNMDRFDIASTAYTPISFQSLPTFLTLCAVSLIGYGVPRIFGTKIPPLLASLCYGGMFLGISITVMMFVQLWPKILNIVTIYLLLFPFNYVICCIRLIRANTKKYCEQLENTEYNLSVLRLCKRILKKTSSFIIFSFVLAIPLLIIVIIILLLFGQKPDSVITAFTETAEWTLSQKIPPPRMDYQGHYLCTTAACGDKKIVKPLRAGRRGGRLIVVNRQLLVANAFEDLIQEKTPHLHKVVRGIYDKCGLPISKYITTKKRSNAVYYFMKPLEWLFVIILYLFDVKPENRIATQYLK